jgi:hypothetical protein
MAITTKIRLLNFNNKLYENSLIKIIVLFLLPFPFKPKTLTYLRYPDTPQKL